jgi:hypothetical protein
MRIAMAKTLHVFPSDGGWALKAEGESAKTFGTRQEAVSTAVTTGKKAKQAQVVVHGKDGRILEHQSYGLPRIQDPPRKGRLDSKKIAAAVGRVVLDRLRAGSQHTSEK